MKMQEGTSEHARRHKWECQMYISEETKLLTLLNNVINFVNPFVSSWTSNGCMRGSKQVFLELDLLDY